MELQREISRSCKECGGLLVGRVDQVYCSDLCRTSANNKRVRQAVKGLPECVNRIQKTLLANYKIMEQLHKRGSMLFSKLYLHDLGFNFHYYTSSIEQNDAQVFYCFNQGYAIQNDQVILVAQSDLYS
jgi:hypothetical protein